MFCLNGTELSRLRSEIISVQFLIIEGGIHQSTSLISDVGFRVL